MSPVPDCRNGCIEDSRAEQTEGQSRRYASSANQTHPIPKGAMWLPSTALPVLWYTLACAADLVFNDHSGAFRIELVDLRCQITKVTQLDFHALSDHELDGCVARRGWP